MPESVSEILKNSVGDFVFKIKITMVYESHHWQILLMFNFNCHAIILKLIINSIEIGFT